MSKSINQISGIELKINIMARSVSGGSIAAAAKAASNQRLCGIRRKYLSAYRNIINKLIIKSSNMYLQWRRSAMAISIGGVMAMAYRRRKWRKAYEASWQRSVAYSAAYGMYRQQRKKKSIGSMAHGVAWRSMAQPAERKRKLISKTQNNGEKQAAAAAVSICNENGGAASANEKRIEAAGISESGMA